MTGTPMWPFDQSENTAAITIWPVLRGETPVVTVAHYSEDHSWGFFGGDDFSMADAAVVSMAQVVSRDPTLYGIADLEPGWVASRTSVGGAWTRRFNPEV